MINQTLRSIQAFVLAPRAHSMRHSPTLYLSQIQSFFWPPFSLSFLGILGRRCVLGSFFFLYRETSNPMCPQDRKARQADLTEATAGKSSPRVIAVFSPRGDYNPAK